MKPYRRNWILGVAAVVCGIVVNLASGPGVLKIGSLYAIGAGIVLAGWSGRVWVYEEKQKNAANQPEKS